MSRSCSAVCSISELHIYLLHYSKMLKMIRQKLSTYIKVLYKNNFLIAQMEE